MRLGWVGLYCIFVACFHLFLKSKLHMFFICFCSLFTKYTTPLSLSRLCRVVLKPIFKERQWRIFRGAPMVD
ncbi:hypothetical protein HanIR_Chr07g0329171 [Helianthus annuus]|nr:hypothetical protein HanIR_Chr07g0329171 [Helianthus annuus]